MRQFLDKNDFEWKNFLAKKTPPAFPFRPHREQ
jgi:hypothetical protein